MSPLKPLTGLALALAVSFLAAPADAVTPAPAIGSVYAASYTQTSEGDVIYFNKIQQSFAGADLDIGFADVSAAAGATLSGGPIQRLTASAGLQTGDGLLFSDAQSRLFYSFAASGPADAIVPVKMQALLDVSATGDNASASALFQVFRLGDFQLVYQAHRFADHDGALGPSSVDTRLNLRANELYGVSLVALTGLRTHSLTPIQSTFAMVDPYFSIDPGFLGANPGFSLQFSDGIGNAPNPDFPVTDSVPEPATWALMILGLGSVGVAMRRRKLAAAV